MKYFGLACLLWATTASAAVTAPSITVSPTPVSLRLGAQQTFTATPTGLTNPTIAWKVVSTAASSTGSLGTITSAGVYTAPSTLPTPATVTIEAISTSGGTTVTGTAQVTLLPNPTVTVAPTPVSLRLGTPQTFTATATGLTNPTYTWKVVSTSASPTGSLGTITSAGAYTPPATLPTPATILIQAVATASGLTATGSAQVTLLPAPSISVTPTPVSIRLGAQQTFKATATGLTNPTYTWKVVSTGSAPAGSLGTITSAGVYTAPATMPNPGTVTIQAISTTSTSTVTGTADVTLLNPVPAVTSLVPANINTGLPYDVIINGSGFLPTSQVLLGTTAATGVKYISATQLEITGTSAAAAGTKIAVSVVNPDPGTKTSAVLSLNVLGAVSLTVTPDKQTIRLSGTETFTAHVTNAATTADAAVTWAVNGKTGGDAATGTIDSKGVYTPPAVLPATPAVTITATSLEDTTKNASVTLNLENPVPVLTAVPTSLTAGAQTVTVTGTGFAPGAVIWFAGSAVPTTVVSSTKLTASFTVAFPAGGTAAIKVVNPNPGSATSNVLPVPVAVANAQMSYLDAVRFLEQATFGPTPADIEHLQTIGKTAWLSEQFAMPASAWADPLANEGVGPLKDHFFTIALTGKDQLRQRVALALAEIQVVSGNKDMQYSQMVNYQRQLANDAFGSYRTLLGDMTLNPAMGYYLDMVNNAKANPAKGTAANENYARESMQLFTVGLQQLNTDGTPIPGAAPEYDAATVTDLAKVFTGWTYAPVPGFQKEWNDPEYDLAPMVAIEAYHDTTQKQLNLPIPCTIPAGGTAQGDLDAALDCLYKQQNVAPFISYRLIQRLVESSPTPAYVGRVAGVFKATGGNLQAVVTAILTDDEASKEGTGKLREPILQATTLLRELNANVLNSNATGVAGQSAAMGQIPLEPASVFSYFSPFFRVNGVVAPEFQALNAETEFARVNFAYRAVNNSVSSNLKVDFSNWQDLAASASTLAQAINVALYRGEMLPAELDTVAGAAKLSTNSLTSVRDAVYVAAAAPQYQIEK